MYPTKTQYTQTHRLSQISKIQAKFISVSQPEVVTKPILDDEYINLLFDTISYKQELYEHYTEAKTSGNYENIMDFLADTF